MDIYALATEITLLSEDYDTYSFMDCYALCDFEEAVKDTLELITLKDESIREYIISMIEDVDFWLDNADRLLKVAYELGKLYEEVE